MAAPAPGGLATGYCLAGFQPAPCVGSLSSRYASVQAAFHLPLERALSPTFCVTDVLPGLSPGSANRYVGSPDFRA